MRVDQSSFCNFRNIQVSQLILLALRYKDVRTLYVSVKDLPAVQNVQGAAHMAQGRPYVFLIKISLGFDVLLNFISQVPLLRIFHNYAEQSCGFIDKGLVVAYDVAVFNGSQNTHFIQSILLVLVL